MSKESEIRSNERGKLDAEQGKDYNPPHSSIAEMLFKWSDTKGQAADIKAYKEGYEEGKIRNEERKK